MSIYYLFKLAGVLGVFVWKVASMAFAMCEDMLYSMETQKAVPAPFLTKTYQLVDDPLTDLIVSWGENNATFVVWRPPEFARDLLPKYFKHNNFSSFIRQLNTYGFKKVVADRWEFANECFRKGARHLLSEIQRRSKMPNYGFVHQNQMHFQDTNQQVQHYLPPNKHMYHEWNLVEQSCSSWSRGSDVLAALTEDNQRLRRKNNMLVSELAHTKNLYNNIIYFIQNHVKPVPSHDRKPQRTAKLVEVNAGYCLDQPYVDISAITMPSANSSPVKIFGVPLCGKKRLHQDTYHP